MRLWEVGTNAVTRVIKATDETHAEHTIEQGFFSATYTVAPY